jgi:hypothetical protein
MLDPAPGLSVSEDQALDNVDDQMPAMRIDVEQVARLVYQLMLQDQAIERERGAWRRAL